MKKHFSSEILNLKAMDKSKRNKVPGGGDWLQCEMHKLCGEVKMARALALTSDHVTVGKYRLRKGNLTATHMTLLKLNGS